MIKWIATAKELPPCDGVYEICNQPDKEDDPLRREMSATAYYDGWGFNHLGIYREPRYWRKYPEPSQKKYGPVIRSLHEEKP